MLLTRSATKTVYESYKIEVTDELIQELKGLAKDYFSIEGDFELTAEDVANIWSGDMSSYDEDSPILISKVQETWWGSEEVSVASLLKNELNEMMWERDAWVEDSEVEDWTDGVQ